MKKYLIVLFFLCTILTTACSHQSVYEPTEVENVAISISDVSSTGAVVTIKDRNKEPYIYGTWFAIEEKTESGWKPLKPIISNYGFEEIGYLPSEKGEVVFEINWEWLYGELPSGNYRLLKEVNHQHISIEFSL